MPRQQPRKSCDARRHAKRMRATGYVVTEQELHDFVKSIFICGDPEMRKSLTAYREFLEDKLKNHHSNLKHSVPVRPCKKGKVSVCL